MKTITKMLILMASFMTHEASAKVVSDFVSVKEPPPSGKTIFKRMKRSEVAEQLFVNGYQGTFVLIPKNPFKKRVEIVVH